MTYEDLITEKELSPSLYEKLLKEGDVNFSNPNLLINGDFQVWQRGTRFSISKSSNVFYTADRWRFQTNSQLENATCEKTNNGFKLTTQSADYVYHVVQVLEPEYTNKLLGKTVTFTAKINSNVSDDNIGLELWTEGRSYGFCKSKGDIFIGTFHIDTVNNNLGVTLGINNAMGFIEVEWVKLEVGDKATPFIPRHYAEELELCQRYYKDVIVSSICMNSNGLYIPIRFPVKMRIIPTVKFEYGGVVNNFTASGILKSADNVQPWFNSTINGSIRVSSTTNLASIGDITYMDFYADAEIY